MAGQLEQLKSKYQSVINYIQNQPGASLKNVHIEDGKLLIRATMPSEEAKNRVWDQIKLVDPNFGDLKHEITVDQNQQPQQGNGQTYTVQPGDTLSKISKQVYGDANMYGRIFDANRDTLKDPNKIQPGQRLKIPAA